MVWQKESPSTWDSNVDDEEGVRPTHVTVVYFTLTYLGVLKSDT